MGDFVHISTALREAFEDIAGGQGLELDLVTFTNEWDREPKPMKVKLESLLGKAHRIRESKEGCPAYSLVKYKQGAVRGNEGVSEITGLVFDFDHVRSSDMKQVSERLNGYAYVAHSTFSHRLDGPEDNCFRIVVPLKSPIRPNEYRSIWPKIDAWLGGKADSHASDPARIFYYPSCPEERREMAFIRYRKGEVLDTKGASFQETLSKIQVKEAGAIGKGERNAMLTSLAGSMRRRGSERKEIEYELLRENRSRCRPPLSESEVRRIATSVSRYEPTKIQTPKLTFTPIRELLAKPRTDTNWLIDGLLPAGGISMIASKPKCRKSTLMREMALAVARGRTFLGRSVTAGAVLFLALEEREADVVDHFRKMGATDEPILIHAGAALENGLAQVKEAVLVEKPALIVVDTLARLVGIRDMNDYAQVTQRLTPLLNMAHEHGCHVALVHHAKKTDAESIDAPLGSTALSGSVDTLLVMKRKEEYRTLCTIQRTGEDLPESVLSFDKETGLTSLTGTKDDYEICGLERTLLAYLSEQIEPVSEKTIKQDVEGNNNTKQRALRNLVAENRVVRTGEGKKGSEYRYSLPESSLSHFPPKENTEVRNSSEGLSIWNHKGKAHLDESSLLVGESEQK